MIEVADDGVGMSNGASALRRTGAGIGMKNVQERLEVLYGNQARFNVVSNPGRGTLVSIEIPAECRCAGRGSQPCKLEGRFLLQLRILFAARLMPRAIYSRSRYPQSMVRFTVLASGSRATARLFPADARASWWTRA